MVMNEEEKMVVAKCNGCGRMWDINGCSVSGQGPFIVQPFICDRCQEKKEVS
jgi:hypothetical protein